MIDDIVANLRKGGCNPSVTKLQDMERIIIDTDCELSTLFRALDSYTNIDLEKFSGITKNLVSPDNFKILAGSNFDMESVKPNCYAFQLKAIEIKKMLN